MLQTSFWVYIISLMWGHIEKNVGLPQPEFHKKDQGNSLSIWCIVQNKFKMYMYRI